MTSPVPAGNREQPRSSDQWSVRGGFTGCAGQQDLEAETRALIGQVAQQPESAVVEAGGEVVDDQEPVAQVQPLQALLGAADLAVVGHLDQVQVPDHVLEQVLQGARAPCRGF